VRGEGSGGTSAGKLPFEAPGVEVTDRVEAAVLLCCRCRQVGGNQLYAVIAVRAVEVVLVEGSCGKILDEGLGEDDIGVGLESDDRK
jgi:hypothetical protein